MIEFIKNLPPAVSLLALVLSVVFFLFGRLAQLRTLSAKYRDRLYDLNKLTIQFGDVALEYFSKRGQAGYYDHLEKLNEPSATEANPNAQLAIRVRAYVLYRLNFYEEVFHATRSKVFVAFEDQRTWREYVRHELQYPLVAELLNKEGSRFGSKFVEWAREQTDRK